MLGLWPPAPPTDVLKRHLVLLLTPFLGTLSSIAQPLLKSCWQLTLAASTHLVDDMLDEGLAQVVASVRRYDLRHMLPLVL